MRFQCNDKKCKNVLKKNQVPLKRNTWFSRSKISFRKNLLIIYSFINKLPYKIAQHESSISSGDDSESEKILKTSSETIVDYYKSCKEVCEFGFSLVKKTKIGGPGLTVQIDESKFGKRKYNKGRKVKGQWVLGGICSETNDVFLIPVDKRDKETLIPLIVENVEQGSRIVTDCWAAYNDLQEHGFVHETVNHSENFIDPDTGANTQKVENLWRCIKRTLPDTHKVNEEFNLVLAEYLWRRYHTHRKNDLFEEFLKNASLMYM